MAEARWRVGLIDSGAAAGLPVSAARRFVDRKGEVFAAAPVADPSGHGTAIASLLARARNVDLVVAQVLDGRGRSTPATVAAGIEWAVDENVRLLHLSLGLANDRAVLATAIARAVDSGVIVLAAVPARGRPTWPAAYPGVIRATGDARCAPEEISHLGSATADFGGCPRFSASTGRVLRGASIGAAHVTGFLLTHAARGVDGAAAALLLAATARHRGVETRGHLRTCNSTPAFREST